MSEYLVQDITLTAIADAVRAKKGTTEPIALTDFATEIESIQTGGGSASNKLALVVGKQSADNLYEITEEDLSGITEIKPYSFNEREGLSTIVLPSGISSIGNNAFSNCKNLTTITLPLSVKTIGTNAFYYCSKIGTVFFLGSLEDWCNITFSSDQSNPMHYGGQYADGNLYIGEHLIEGVLDIPSSITSLNNFVFCGCYKITNINFPDGLTQIGKNCFSSCHGISYINTNAVETVGKEAFSFIQNDGFTVVLPNVKTLGDSAFYRSYGLTSVTMPKIETIGGEAFYCCEELTSITIPSTCTSIGNRAFYLQNGKCTFTFEGQTPPTIGAYVFGAYSGDTSSVKKIIVPQGCGDTYKTATNWTTLANKIVEASF